jgi:hypothetical protein
MIDARYSERGEDYASWEAGESTYQVDFWTHLTDRLPDTQPEKVGYKKDAYLLSGAAEVDQVMAWVRDNAEGRIAVVYAVIPDTGYGRGLFRLSGSDPTRPG